jgi:hypothetical protein
MKSFGLIRVFDTMMFSADRSTRDDNAATADLCDFAPVVGAAAAAVFRDIALVVDSAADAAAAFLSFALVVGSAAPAAHVWLGTAVCFGCVLTSTVAACFVFAVVAAVLVL